MQGFLKFLFIFSIKVVKYVSLQSVSLYSICSFICSTLFFKFVSKAACNKSFHPFCVSCFSSVSTLLRQWFWYLGRWQADLKHEKNSRPIKRKMMSNSLSAFLATGCVTSVSNDVRLCHKKKRENFPKKIIVYKVLSVDDSRYIYHSNARATMSRTKFITLF